jgi:ABC-type bacteriocin/lantibiotic exporter with double-glycine peptidase domain
MRKTNYANRVTSQVITFSFKFAIHSSVTSGQMETSDARLLDINYFVLFLAQLYYNQTLLLVVVVVVVVVLTMPYSFCSSVSLSVTSYSLLVCHCLSIH